jgi:putative salt-induced outer membrane protein YdiY
MRPLVFALALAVSTAWTALAEEVELISGERLTGRIARRSAERLVLDHAILGSLGIPLSAVRSIDGRPLPPAEEQAPRQSAEESAERKPSAEKEAEATATEPPQPPPAPEWDSQIELGAAAREGTTDEANLRAALRTTRRRPGHQFKYDATYRLATVRGDRTENRFSTGFFSEWDRPRPRWTAFAQGRYDMAEFQSWEQRLTAAGGVGYRLMDLKCTDEEGRPYDAFVLIGRIGAGLRQEWGSENEDLSPEGLLGAEFTYRVNSHQTLAGETTAYPDLGDTGEFRLVSALNWSLDIDRADGISLKFGFTHEYESRTGSGVSHNDLAAFGALVIDF